ARVEMANNLNHFGVYLRCNQDSVYDHWRVEHTSTITAVSRNKPESSKSLEFSDSYEKENVSWGRREFALFSDIMNTEEGFIQDDKVLLEARISVEAVDGMKKLVLHDFSQVHEDSDSVTLRIGGENVYVSKGYLAIQSPYFSALFFKDFKEKNQSEIELEDVSFQEFIEFLHTAYPSNKPITVDSHKYILELADRYQVQRNKFLHLTSTDRALFQMTREFKKLSDSMHRAILKRVLALTK
ncbi:hypothetical protein PENTCL1PPCAC_24803, partial [Pristionchus entomophagus]